MVGVTPSTLRKTSQKYFDSLKPVRDAIWETFRFVSCKSSFADSNRTRVIDAVRFGAQENGVASGRSPDGSPTIRRLASPTRGTNNAPWRLESIVINEIMFHPLEPDAEYVEIFNTSTNFAFDLSNWRINGLDYTFPPGTVITNRQLIVLAKDPAAFIRAYGTAIPVLGVFSGNLQSDGETLTLIRPAAGGNEADLVVDKVRYENRTPWSTNANGTGSSLQVIDPNQENSREFHSPGVVPLFRRPAYFRRAVPLFRGADRGRKKKLSRPLNGGGPRGARCDRRQTAAQGFGSW